MKDESKVIFRDEQYEGIAKGGIFIRSNLFQLIQEMEQRSGQQVVGIVKPRDWNLEFIMSEQESEETE